MRLVKVCILSNTNANQVLTKFYREAAFDYQFGALDNAENELTNTYTNLV